MSNEVYGYVVVGDKGLNNDNQSLFNFDTPLGFFTINSTELYGFSSPYLPSQNDISFMISDSPNSKNATYLVDFIDYADEANIVLPHKGHERLSLLEQLIKDLFIHYNAQKVVIAVTDSSQIEEIKEVSMDLFLGVLIEDSKKFAPPSCLYIINSCPTQK